MADLSWICGLEAPGVNSHVRRASVAGLFYLALRVVPPRLMWLRAVRVVLAVLFIGEFVFLLATCHPR